MHTLTQSRAFTLLAQQAQESDITTWSTATLFIYHVGCPAISAIRCKSDFGFAIKTFRRRLPAFCLAFRSAQCCFFASFFAYDLPQSPAPPQPPPPQRHRHATNHHTM
jgi:hypothetical protein